MHELTNLIDHNACIDIKDKQIIGWLKEKAVEMRKELEFEERSSCDDSVHKILGLSKKTLEEKFLEELQNDCILDKTDPSNKEYYLKIKETLVKTCKELAQIAEKHYEK